MRMRIRMQVRISNSTEVLLFLFLPYLYVLENIFIQSLQCFLESIWSLRERNEVDIDRCRSNERFGPWPNVKPPTDQVLPEMTKPQIIRDGLVCLKMSLFSWGVGKSHRPAFSHDVSPRNFLPEPFGVSGSEID